MSGTRSIADLAGFVKNEKGAGTAWRLVSLQLDIAAEAITILRRGNFEQRSKGAMLDYSCVLLVCGLRPLVYLARRSWVVFAVEFGEVSGRGSAVRVR